MEQPSVRPYRLHVFVCTDPKKAGCLEKGGEEVRTRFRTELSARGLLDDVRVSRCGSIGLCVHGPNIIIYPEGVWYSHVSPDDVPEIIDEHLVNGRVVKRLFVHKLGE